MQGGHTTVESHAGDRSTSAADAAALTPDVFRAELRAWLDRTLPSIWGAPTPPVRPTEDDDMAMRHRYDRALYAAGWAALSWPAEYGGIDAPVDYERVLAEESARAEAPERYNRVGLGIVAPALIHHGSDAQKARYLRPLLAADEIWCQGFSEPNAGSDLAGLTTRAALVDGRWRITGQKVWTTLSSIADFCFLLARTGGPDSGHRGITAFIVPMHQAGVTVRPIRQINDSTEFSEVFFDDAETVSEPVIGAIDGGWKLAMSVLSYERSTNLLNRQTRLAVAVRALRLAARRYDDTVPDLLLDDLVDVWIRSEALRFAVREHLEEIGSGQPPGIGNNATKVYWSETYQALGDLALQMRGLRPGPGAELLDEEPDWYGYYLGSRAASIYAGTDEIQRNIIAERGLGLPRARS
jgi:alkylation response protein AidB-like acyl-CoA dehydrogenase